MFSVYRSSLRDGVCYCIFYGVFVGGGWLCLGVEGWRKKRDSLAEGEEMDSLCM